jgi:hypothetical protein
MSFNPRDRRNPYLLTWALRGIIEDPQVRELFSNELIALREAYEVRRSLDSPASLSLADPSLRADLETADQGLEGRQAQARGHPHDELARREAVNV